MEIRNDVGPAFVIRQLGGGTLAGQLSYDRNQDSTTTLRSWLVNSGKMLMNLKRPRLRITASTNRVHTRLLEVYPCSHERLP